MKSVDAATAGTGRVLSIDALRGFDMFWIAGGVPLLQALIKVFVDPVPKWLTDQFEHKLWNGFTAEDLIMPLFLFVVGTAMPFSFTKRIEQGQSKEGLYLKVLRRVIILWVLGMIMQGRLLEYDLTKLRVFSNTLQAIAVGYAFAAIVMLNLRVVWQAVTIPVLLVTYWLLMALVPFPGRGEVAIDREANLGLWLDRWVLGRFHDGFHYVWILAGLGFTATVLLGVMSGHLLRSKRSDWWKVAVLLGLGAGLLVVGRIWGIWFPINKHIWSGSMVLWAGGLSILLLAAFYLVIDVLGWRAWAFPFVVIGANAITAYMIGKFISFEGVSNVLVGKLVPHLRSWGEFVNVHVGNLVPHLGSCGDFVQKLVAFAAMWLVLWYMYRNRTFIRI